MKYEPEPISRIKEIGRPGATPIKRNVREWKVEFEEDGGGYCFYNQDDAMTFCLLLEIRDLLRKIKLLEEGSADG